MCNICPKCFQQLLQPRENGVFHLATCSFKTPGIPRYLCLLFGFRGSKIHFPVRHEIVIIHCLLIKHFLNVFDRVSPFTLSQVMMWSQANLLLAVASYLPDSIDFIPQSSNSNRTQCSVFPTNVQTIIKRKKRTDIRHKVHVRVSLLGDTRTRPSPDCTENMRENKPMVLK